MKMPGVHESAISLILLFYAYHILFRLYNWHSHLSHCTHYSWIYIYQSRVHIQSHLPHMVERILKLEIIDKREREIDVSFQFFKKGMTFLVMSKKNFVLT